MDEMFGSGSMYPGGPMSMMGLGEGMFGQDPQKKKKKGIGFNPLMLLSPFGGLMAESPKTAMSLMSPAFGIANLLGAFK